MMPPLNREFHRASRAFAERPLARRAAGYSLSPQSYTQRATRRMSELIAASDLVVRIDHYQLMSMLEDGRLANQHETADSGGTLDPGIRAYAELSAFDIPGAPPTGLEEERLAVLAVWAQANADLLPVYGYLSSPAHDPAGCASPIAGYGPYKLILTDEVRNRVYVCQDDSLDRIMAGRAPEPLRRPHPAAFSSDPLQLTHLAPDDRRFLRDDQAEVEAIIFGGVALSHVDRVELDPDFDLAADRREGELTPLLDALGVSWMVAQPAA